MRQSSIARFREDLRLAREHGNEEAVARYQKYLELEEANTPAKRQADKIAEYESNARRSTNPKVVEIFQREAAKCKAMNAAEWEHQERLMADAHARLHARAQATG
jgi:hypothetical protein